MIHHQRREKSGAENFRETQEFFYEKSKISTRVISKGVT